MNESLRTINYLRGVIEERDEILSRLRDDWNTQADYVRSLTSQIQEKSSMLSDYVDQIASLGQEICKLESIKIENLAESNMLFDKNEKLEAEIEAIKQRHSPLVWRTDLPNGKDGIFLRSTHEKEWVYTKDISALIQDPPEASNDQSN